MIKYIEIYIAESHIGVLHELPNFPMLFKDTVLIKTYQI